MATNDGNLPTLEITVVSDVICPWCFIGTRRLRKVLDAMEGEVTPQVRYQPFLLDPTVPPEGADLRDRLRRKYGADPDTMFARIEDAARQTGIALDFSIIRRTPNTIPAHILLRHAEARGTQGALSDALFTAYFLDGQDIGDTDVLAPLAASHGFSAAEARTLVADEREQAVTRDEAQAAARAGISGVPFFVFANRVALSGAQPAHVFRAAIAQALEGATTA
jgi:predicted DsbA family dithiol-disulfide isomerase